MKAMRGRIALQKHFVRSGTEQIQVPRSFAMRTACQLCVRACLRRFLLLSLHFVQLLLNRSFFAAHIAQMTLKKR